MQNTSHAVMAQRKESVDSLDDFPTPCWATRALIKYVICPEIAVYYSSKDLIKRSAWEPACNRGYMARPLREAFGRIDTSDIHDYRGDHGAVCPQGCIGDFLSPGCEPPIIQKYGVSWVITNPPFRLAEQFIRRSFEFKNWEGTAILVRTQFLEGIGRYTDLFSKRPPSAIAQFSERVPMVRGRIDHTATTATAYCWLIWMRGVGGTKFVWIPPCRKLLERDGDYPTAGVAA